jgi:CxxC motif-containing protein (DUF1111 family)
LSGRKSHRVGFARAFAAAAFAAGTLVTAGVPTGAPSAAAEPGRAAFINSRDPPTYRVLSASDRERFELGHAIFNTHFVPAGMPNAARRDGLGPLFNSSACDACHNEGAHGRGPTGDGPLPDSVVVELSQPGSSLAHPLGDPHYGRTFNRTALDGFLPEGDATVKYVERTGRYGDGESWTLRVPQYEFTKLHYGPLASNTIVQPRIAPALFGTGLLEQVAGADQGRFGWQNTAVSLADQTAQALSRDMGLTSPLIDHDDCTASQKECRAAMNGGTPEISKEFLNALVAFQENLAVPERLQAGPTGAHADQIAAAGQTLFSRLGCAACHTPTQDVPIEGIGQTVIHPYSDLKAHDLGNDLADKDVTGHPVSAAFRTPPLWGMGYRLKREQFPTFLHDGRARSLSEAIVWHGGEASAAKEHFLAASAAQRSALIGWLSTL